MKQWQFLLTAFVAVGVVGCGGAGGSDPVSAPPAITIEAPTSVAVGARVIVVAKSEDRDGGAIISQTWEQTAGPILQLSGIQGESVEFNAPRTAKTADVTLQHCVVDDERDRACKEATITVLSAVDLGLRGGIGVFLSVTDPLTGLPRDEASLRELQNGRFNSVDWWPQHAALLMMSLVVGHALTELDRDVFDVLEIDDEGLIDRFDALLDSLELIVKDRSRHYPARDFLAFYHIYKEQLPQTDSLGRFVLFEDNALLYAGLSLAQNYLRPLDAATADRVAAVRKRLDLSLWKAPDGRISIGTTELPVAEGRIDRFTTQQRISVVAARASGALSRSEFATILTDLFARSARSPTVVALPPIGKMMEVYAAVPWLGENDTALRAGLLDPLYRGHVAAAARLSVPVSHTSVPVVQRKTVEYALSPFEGRDELLEDLQDLPVITAPGGAMLTALRSQDSLVNYEEIVLILENELEGGIDARFGPPNAFDYGITATIPEDVSPMYGVLETGYGVAALASNRLDRDFIVNTLRKDLGWDEAIRDYRDIVAGLIANPPAPIPPAP